MEIPDMQHQVMGYDRSATMFSPDGHILQVEYAEKTVRLGTASIGIKCEDGIIIVSDKGEKDSLIISESADKIYEIDEQLDKGLSKQLIYPVAKGFGWNLQDGYDLAKLDKFFFGKTVDNTNYAKQLLAVVTASKILFMC
mgnify:CR=1 FL=1